MTLVLLLFIVFFFFFQAEDGIRDSSVTGVQTCALPDLDPKHAAANQRHGSLEARFFGCLGVFQGAGPPSLDAPARGVVQLCTADRILPGDQLLRRWGAEPLIPKLRLGNEGRTGRLFVSLDGVFKNLDHFAKQVLGRPFLCVTGFRFVLPCQCGGVWEALLETSISPEGGALANQCRST